MDLNDFLKNMSKEDFEKNLKKARDFMNTPDGAKLAEKLGGKAGTQNIQGMDKDAILNELSKNPDILKKIQKLMKG